NHAVLQVLNPEQVEVEICRSEELDQRRGLTSELDEMWSYVRSGFVKLLRLRCSSGERVPLPGPIRPLGGPLRACHFGPTRESLPHLLTIVGCGQQMPSRSKVLGNGAVGRQKTLGMPC